MKRFLLYFLSALMVLALSVSSAALAQTEADFIRGADGKTGMAEIFSAEVQDEKVVYTSVGTLAANTYVSYTGNEDETAGYVECSYYADGSLQTAWLKKADIIPAYTIVYFEDGSYVNLPDSIARDEQALSEYCNTYFPGRPYTSNEDSALLDANALLSVEGAAALYGDAKKPMKAKLVQVGLYTSKILTAKGDEVDVLTAQLSFGDNTDAKKRVAVISAPRGGEASLRKEAGNSPLIANAKAGRIVAVMEPGATYTKVIYDGMEGYVRTNCLVFFGGDKAPEGTGVVHVDGAVDGANEVVLRNATSTSKAKVVSVKTGTAVDVYEIASKWYGVETDGWFGYIQAQNLNVEK